MDVPETLVVIDNSDNIEAIAFLAAVERPGGLCRTGRGMFEVDMRTINVADTVRKAVEGSYASFEVVSLVQGGPIDDLR